MIFIFNNSVEYRICTKLTARVLAGPYTLSVFDGEEWVLKDSKDMAQILAVMFSGESDKLRIRTLLGKFVGDILLLHGDGENVIANWTDNQDTNDLIKEVHQAAS
jgi:hypothetical protein